MSLKAVAEFEACQLGARGNRYRKQRCCLSICAGVACGTQDDYERQGPPQPTAFPVIEIGTATIPEWETITTYEVESLSLSSKVIRTGAVFTLCTYLCRQSRYRISGCSSFSSSRTFTSFEDKNFVPIAITINTLERYTAQESIE